MDVVASLQAELNETNAKLAALDQLKNDRATLTAQASRLTKAIAMLSGEPVVRKPLSDDAKARIKAGLEKARAAKVASATTAAQPNATQPAATGQETTGKKGPAPEKGAGRGVN